MNCEIGKDRRTEIAGKYIRGIGIELGALNHPLNIPSNTFVKYVDRLDIQQLKEQYPEVSESEIRKPDILDDAQELENIKNEIYDFCIANHVLEHMRDPIGALLNWLRVLKPGGILYLSIPDINNYLDFGRNLTTLDHIICDNSKNNKREDYLHFEDCAKYWNKLSEPQEIRKKAFLNHKKKYSIHFHTFNHDSIIDMLSYISSVRKDLLEILEFVENVTNDTKEYIVIIEKKMYVDKILDILNNREYNELSKRKHLDIIIPVFNAYPDFVRCLYSVIKTDLDNRIILIDDKSDDPRVTQLFSKLAMVKSNQLVLIKNDENLGFVKTVNKGMRVSNNDVILLNSDTIVTPKWVIKLQTCAYSDEKIGTVTPFTNSGTICSIPNFCEFNQIPEGFTIESFAEYIERISFKIFPEIPTAVGFCMYIKRQLIESIGYFDEVNFGKGYGEENDYCMRAMNKGFKNTLSDDTFIFHKEGSSFSTQKSELNRKNLKILSKMYPNYLRSVATFCRNNPLSQIHENIRSRMQTWDQTNGKKKILFILHNLGGGTEVHVMDLVESLNKSYIFYICKIVNNYIILSEINNGSVLEYSFFMSNPVAQFESHNENYKKLLENIIDTFRVNFIHVHHLIGHTLDVFELAEERQIPIIFTVHDYYVVCPRINLLDGKNRYCHEINNINTCSTCIKETLHLSNDFIKIWRNRFEDAINKTDMIIAPNNSVFEILRKYYPTIDLKRLVIEHGHKKELLEKHLLACNNKKLYSINGSFNIASVGVLAPHKGSQLFYDLASSENLKNKTRWIVIGISSKHSDSGYYEDSGVEVKGKYDDFQDLAIFIKNENVNLVIIPSLWPETFSFVLSEAWACGIPVLVSDVGALKERVERTGGGWCAHVADKSSFEKRLLKIIDDKEDYLRKKDAVSNIRLASLNIVMREYESLYENRFMKSSQIYYSDSSLSNLELFQSIEKNTTLNKLKTHIETTPNDQTIENALINRFFKCIAENGWRYTAKRFVFYFKNKL